MIGRAVRCSSGRPTPPRPGRSGRPSPWAAQSFPVLIGAAAVLIGAGSGQKKSQGRRRGVCAAALALLLCRRGGAGRRGCPGAVVVLIQGRRRAPAAPAQFQPPQFQPEPFQGGTVSPPLIRQNAAGRRGQILHLTAYRPIGNGELGSMPPYYPPLAPFFPGFRRGESITGHSFGASLQDIGLHTLSSRRRCCPDFSAPIFRGSNLD